MHISEFQQLIAQKYKKTDLQRGIPATFMWFIEEVGELATALASKDQANKEGMNSLMSLPGSARWPT